jgi:hypothetical protein
MGWLGPKCPLETGEKTWIEFRMRWLALLGGELITIREEDHEQVTDLVPVFLGLGLFAANSPVRDRSPRQNRYHGFTIDQQGYLPSRMIGFRQRRLPTFYRPEQCERKTLTARAVQRP